jgi:hypothetical protein
LIRNLDLCGAVNGAARHAMDVWQREDAAVRGAVGHLETAAAANVGDAIEKLAKMAESSSSDAAAADKKAVTAVKSALEAQALVINALLADREERTRAMHYLGETAEERGARAVGEADDGQIPRADERDVRRRDAVAVSGEVRRGGGVCRSRSSREKEWVYY